MRFSNWNNNSQRNIGVDESIVRLWQYALGSYSDEKTEPYDKGMLIIKQDG